jgi:OOP family OmpA-OmpF porin
MRNFTTTLWLITALLCSNLLLNAQSNEDPTISPHMLSAKILFVDYALPNGFGMAELPISNGLEIAYIRNVNRFLNIGIPVRANLANVSGFMNRRTILSGDIIVQLQYEKMPGSLLVPYVMGGGGLASENFGDLNVQFPVGAGLNLRVAPNAYINLQGEYRTSQAEVRNNLQYGAGLLFRLGQLKKQEVPEFSDRDGDGVPDHLDECPDEAGPPGLLGCPDRDGDGVPDKLDNCPDEPGLPEFQGCPDTDGDGIPDHEDFCPNDPGPKENNGCPIEEEPEPFEEPVPEPARIPDPEPQVSNDPRFMDSDGDGIMDHIDECPYEPGPLSTRGCPDRDGDGVPDKDDKCPDLPGSARTFGCPDVDTDGDGIVDALDDCPTIPGVPEYNGCPKPDRDGDGIPDDEDECPDQPGPASNGGCPELKKEEKEILEFAAQAVTFDQGKATLVAQSYGILDQVAGVLERNPSYKVRIVGHTDNVGKSTNNLRLSEERAKSCYEYLLSKGIPAARMQYKGMGDSQPIASNSTSDGRELNRRVEFDLYLK